MTTRSYNYKTTQLRIDRDWAELLKLLMCLNTVYFTKIFFDILAVKNRHRYLYRPQLLIKSFLQCQDLERMKGQSGTTEINKKQLD